MACYGVIDPSSPHQHPHTIIPKLLIRFTASPTHVPVPLHARCVITLGLPHTVNLTEYALSPPGSGGSERTGHIFVSAKQCQKVAVAFRGDAAGTFHSAQDPLYSR